MLLSQGFILDVSGDDSPFAPLGPLGLCAGHDASRAIAAATLDPAYLDQRLGGLAFDDHKV